MVTERVVSHTDQAEIARHQLSDFRDFQVLNEKRHLGALRLFGREEFGRSGAAPTPAHIEAANGLIRKFRNRLFVRMDELQSTTDLSRSRDLRRFLRNREKIKRDVKSLESIWDYYFEKFVQRQTHLATQLHALDRIALDCYREIYSGLGAARTVPSPPPFTCLESGTTPSTYRRGVPVRHLARNLNPFPVIQLPRFRLANPWSLGALHHEVAHNLQNDLDLWEDVPALIARRLRQAGISEPTVRTWANWHREIWADLCGVLLGGPMIVDSLIDLLGSDRAKVMTFKAKAVHPTPLLRVLISLELLRRMGFRRKANARRQLWLSLYPRSLPDNIPVDIKRTFGRAVRIVVDTVCFHPYRQLGNKELAEVTPFKPTYSPMMRDSAARLAAGKDPGIIPERLLIGAVRWAATRRLASPGKLAKSFYETLSKR